MMNRRQREDVLVRRSVTVETIPSGQPFALHEGQLAQITQALGSSFTLVVEGQLVRLRGEDADAIGKEPPESIVVPENVSTAEIEPLIWETLRTCYDPEIPVNIVDLHLVRGVRINGQCVEIHMTLTAPTCGMGPVLVGDVEYRVGKVPNVQAVKVQLEFDPPWDRSDLSDEVKLELGLPL